VSEKTKKTLDNEEIVTERGVSRRSAIGAMGAAVLGAAAIAAGAASTANSAEAQSGCTDSDSGRNADQANNGRHCRRRACTDSDNGSRTDTGSGADLGALADPRTDGANRGRRC
jgi:hypothetical protein